MKKTVVIALALGLINLTGLSQDSEWAQAFKKASAKPWTNPVLPLTADPRQEPDLKAFIETDDMAVFSTPYFPGWMISCGQPTLTLFHKLPQIWRVAGPTHLAFSSNAKIEIFKAHEAIPAEKLAAMDKAWLLVWFAGARGWEKFDMPMLVVLQHRPLSIEFKDDLRLSFPQKAGLVTLLNLYGYYKPPQDNPSSRRWADIQQITEYGEIKEAKTANLNGAFGIQLGLLAPINVRPYQWSAGLPDHVHERCDYFTALCRAIPYFLRDSFQVDLKENALRLRNSFLYFITSDDWNTPAKKLAPVSPTFALGARYGLLLKFNGQLFDPIYPTPLGPWSGIADTDQYEVSVNLLKYLAETYVLELSQQTNDPIVKKAIETLTVTAPALCKSTAPWGNNQQAYAKRDMKLETGPGKVGNYGAIWVGLTSDRTKGYALRFVKPQDQAQARENMRNYFEYSCFTESGYKEEQHGNKTFLSRDNEDGLYGGCFGDSGKLIMNLLVPAWLYSYHGQDYEWIAPKAPIIEKLTCTLTMLGWPQAGRRCIAELGDEAPPAMGYARLMYAARDQARFAWGAYMTVMELLQAHLKCGPLGDYARKFQPWHRFEIMDDTENATDCWGAGYGWQIGGPGHAKIQPRLSRSFDVSAAKAFGSAQWISRWRCVHDFDFTRFLRENCLNTPGGLAFEFATEMQRDFKTLLEEAGQGRRYLELHPQAHNPANLLAKQRHFLGKSVAQINQQLNGWELSWNDVFKAAWAWEPTPWIHWALADNPKFERILDQDVLPWTPGLDSVYKADNIELLGATKLAIKDPVFEEFMPPFQFFGEWQSPAYPKGSGWSVGLVTVDPNRKIGAVTAENGFTRYIYTKIATPPEPYDLPLEGKQWKFCADNSAQGIKAGWFKREFNDSQWLNIEVPGLWENQAQLPEKALPLSALFPAEIHANNPPVENGGWYDGTAWYRIKFTLPEEFKGHNIFFHAGAIDDFDIVWINGIKIGQTDYQTNPQDFWEATRMYPIPSTALKFGAENVLAVMVCDNNAGGGFSAGPVRLIAKPEPGNP